METRETLSGTFVGEGTLLVQCASSLGWPRRSSIITAEPKIEAWAEQRGIPHVLSSPADLVAYMGERPTDYLFSIANAAAALPPQVEARCASWRSTSTTRSCRKYADACHDLGAADRRRTHGVTWHEMTEAVDGGRIVQQQAIAIRDDDTAFTLDVKCR